MPELDKKSELHLPQPEIPRTPQFSILTNPADARLWADHLSRAFPLWLQNSIDWCDTDHASILYGPPGLGKLLLPEAVAKRLGLVHITTTWDGWIGTDSSYVCSIITAIVETFHDAAKRAPCVLSLHDILTLPTFLRHSPLRCAFVTSALLAEIDGAMKIPGLILIVTQTDSVALAQALLPPARRDRLRAVPTSGIARPANDNAPLTVDQPGQVRSLRRAS